MLSRFIVTICIVGMFCTLNAQNARINAMGDVSVFSDFSSSIYSPTNILSYPDQVQSTLFNSGYGRNGVKVGSGPRLGPFIVSKVITERFYLGLTGNMVYTTGTGSSTLHSNFFRDAVAYLGTNDLGTSFSNTPHILAAFKLNDNLNIGVDAYWESRRYSNYGEVVPKTAETWRVSNIGSKFAMDITLGDLFIGPSVSMSVPSVYHKREVSDSTVIEEKSKDKTALGVDCYAEYPMGKFTFCGDVGYSNETYSFKRGGTNTVQRNNHFISMFAGTNAQIFENVLFAAQYDLSFALRNERKHPDTAQVLTDNHTIGHVIHCGFESPMKGFWIFETLTPRCGAQYSIDGRTVLTRRNETLLTKRNYPLENGEFNVSAGFGLTKGIFMLDVSVDLSAWSGIVVGPTAAMVTATFDFGKLRPKGTTEQ